MSRLRTAVLAVVLCLPMLAGAAWATSPTHTVAKTIWHPYTSPSWYPLHDGIAFMDCGYSNPGCPVAHRHKDHAVTFLTKKTSLPSTYYHAPVYAAGSGYVHIGHSGIKSCPGPAGQPLGNWVWINHGAGVISRYAHLYNIKVHEGEHVTPTTILGYSGNSGESAGNCYIYYLNFQIQHDAVGAFGTGYPLTTSLACKQRHNATVVTDPKFHFGYNTWNDVPKDTMIGYYGHACVNPPDPPNTPSRPVRPTVHVSSGTLTVSWTKPSGGPTITKVDVELQHEWAPGNDDYVLPAHRWFNVGSTFPTSYKYSGLAHGKYRARIAFSSSAGWSLESNWMYGTVT